MSKTVRESLQAFYDYLARPLYMSSRPVLAVLSLLLVLAFFFPIWRISMEAPQYPDGLYMDVWLYKIEGGNAGQHLSEINTLNHYIGMAPIDEVATADLEWIPFAIGLLVLLGLRVAVIGSVRGLLDVTVLALYVSVFAFARFVYRLWVFGHHLAADAPLKVDPFMPVVIGSKQIANFMTHSLPQTGSLFLGLFVLGLLGVSLWHLVSGRVAHVRARQGAREGLSGC